MLRAKTLFLAGCLLATLGSLAAAQDQIPWLTDLRQARQAAEQQQRLVLLHFWSESCAPCLLLEQNVFNRPEFIRVLSTGFIPVKLNVLQQPKIAEFYNVDRVPTDIVVDPTGRELYRTTSPPDLNGYMAMLDQVRTQAAIAAGQSLERIAQKQVQNLGSALPPLGSSFEQANSQSINASPTDVQETWRNSPAGQTISGSKAVPAHRSFVQNKFASLIPQAAPPVAAGREPRHENPYFTESSPNQSPPQAETETAPPAEAEPKSTSPARPWETAGQELGSSPPSPGNAERGSEAQQHPNAQVAPSMPQAWQQDPNAAPNQTAGASQAPQIAPVAGPEVHAPIALEGYCPVTLVLLSNWVKGDPRFGAVHRGRTYLFSSQSDQQRFLADPDRFSPALSGCDPVRYTETGQMVDGKRKHGVACGGTYYLFSDEASLSQFEKQPLIYVNVVRQAMANSRPAGPQR